MEIVLKSDDRLDNVYRRVFCIQKIKNKWQSHIDDFLKNMLKDCETIFLKI